MLHSPNAGPWFLRQKAHGPCRYVLAFVAASAFSSAGLAQGFIQHIEPPVVERGNTTRVTFVGRDLAPGLDVWHSLPPGSMKATWVEGDSARAVFDIAVSAQAAVGVCGLRLATRDGLTNAHLFLIDDLPVRAGASGEEPVSVSLPAAVWGTLREAAIDRYRIEVKAGERLSLEAVASRFGKDADPLVTIRDAAGKFVAERDNDPGLYFDCRFEHVFAKAGRYTVAVRDARFKGNEHRLYVLRLGRFPSARVAVPAAVNVGLNTVTLPGTHGPPFTLPISARPPGSFFAGLRGPGDNGSCWIPLALADGPITTARDNEPTLAQVPGVLCGLLAKPGTRQTFVLKLRKGQRLSIRGETKALNSPAELELSLADSKGKEVRKGVETRGSDEITLEFTAPSAADFFLSVRDALRDGGPAFAYRLWAHSEVIPPQIMAEVEGLTVPQGSYQAVPIVVARGAGQAGVIRLALLGAPPGLKLTPAEIGEKETAVVCRLEADGATPLGVYTVQVLATAETPGGRSTALVRTQPLVDRRIVNIDLVPLTLREDQKRLPPSLTDRLAVQVTPPSHFTFELPEPALTLYRYKRVDVPIDTTRISAFLGPIHFSATGGQLAPKEEGRTRVYAEFPEATPKDARVAGFIQSKILTNLSRTRIDVSASGTHQGQRVTLNRTFDLEIVPAFKIKAEPAKVSLLPGEATRIRVLAERMGDFNGAVTVHLPTNTPFELPEEVTIPKGQAGVDVEVRVPPGTAQRRQNINVTAHGDVGEFEEEVRGIVCEIEVRKPEAPKKAAAGKKK